MMRRSVILLSFILVFALSALAALGQTQVFTSEHVEYTFDLPSPTWRVVAQPDGTHQHLELVYGDRMDGFLQIRKEVVDAETNTSALAQRDQEMKLRFLPGYVDGKEGKGERFAGRLNGVTISYEYTAGGKPMIGRIYYLQADNRTIYTLRFTGLRDKLSLIRNQTDSIARSFKLK